MKKYNVFNEDNNIACFDSDSNRFITRFMDHDQYEKWLSVYQSIGDKQKYGTLLLSTCLRRMRKAHKPTEYERQIKQLGLRTQGQRGAGKKPSKRGIVLQISIRAEKKHLAPKIKQKINDILDKK